MYSFQKFCAGMHTNEKFRKNEKKILRKKNCWFDAKLPRYQKNKFYLKGFFELQKHCFQKIYNIDVKILIDKKCRILQKIFLWA